MTYSSDDEVMQRLREHLEYALNNYPDKDWFVICVQGSQNYGMSDEESDVDTKLLLLPTMEDLVLNKQPVSHTVVLPNNEHCDCKDVRSYFQIFRKSNINFVEILFTDYWIANPRYQDLWLELRARNEELARINPYAAVSCMKGMASEKRHALCHEYPSRMHLIEKYGYDPKQLSHLIRIYYFLKWYINDKPYKDCIYPTSSTIREFLLKYKRDGNGLNKEEAEELADEVMEHIVSLADDFRIYRENKNDPELDEFLNDVLYRMIKRNLRSELNE